MKRIALISEHASPLGTFGGADSGGQNVYVGQIAKHLAAIGYEVDVFTRRDSYESPEIVNWIDGVRIIHVPAGPPIYVRKEDLLPYMEEFTTTAQGLDGGFLRSKLCKRGDRRKNVEELKGKVVLVTGGGRGLGEAICQTLSSAGASLVVADIRLELADKVAEGIRNGGFEAIAMPLDVTNEEQAETVIDKTIA